MPTETSATGSQDYWRRHNQWFDELYTKANWFDRLFRKDVYSRMAVAKQACSELTQPTVLDVGCGSGHVAQSLLEEAGAARLVGIDFSDSMLELAEDLFKRRNLASKAEWIQGDIFTQNFGDQTFDLVIALGVFDYVKEWQALWSKMLALSRKTVVASFPAPSFPRSNLRKWRYGLKGCPVYFYNEGEIDWIKQNSPSFGVEILPGQSGYIVVARRE